MDATCSSSCLYPRVRQFSEPWNASTCSDLQVVHVSEVPRFFDVLMLERHTVSLHFRRGAVSQQFQIIAKARVWKDQDVESFSHCCGHLDILTIHVDKQQKMK